MNNKEPYMRILIPKKKSIDLLSEIDEQFREAGGFPAEGTIYCQQNKDKKQLSFTIKNGYILLINFPLIIKREIERQKHKYVQLRNFKQDGTLEEIIVDRWYTNAPQKTEDSSLIKNDLLILPATIIGKKAVTKPGEILPMISINENISYFLEEIPKESSLIYYKYV